MPGCVIILPKTIAENDTTENGVLTADWGFGIFARQGEKYSCYAPVLRRRDSAYHTRRVGAFHQPVDVVLHRQIFLELMLPAAMVVSDCGFVDWTGFSGNLKPATTLMAVLLLVAAVILPFLPQACRIL